jgi:hypothetical protein
MAIRLHIERLVLDGLALEGLQPRQVQAALEAELTRLLAGGGLAPELAQETAVPALPGATVNWQAGEAPQALGARIGQAVYGSIGT